MSKKIITQNNLPNFWDRVTAYINDRLPKGALASKDTAPISMGGTNAINAKDARVNLGITYGTEVPTETPETGSGAIYFFEDEATPIAVTEGGTGANNAEGALTNLGVADYIIEQGTNGIWTWRKWASGISECWGRYSGSYTGATLTEIVITLPFAFADTNYIIQSTMTSTIGNFSYYTGIDILPGKQTTTQFTHYVYNAHSAALSAQMDFTVRGKWK